MLFKSRKDSSYLSMMGIIILGAFSGLILPILIGSSNNIVVPSLIFGATVGFLLWFIFSMKYTLLEDHLLVKSAFISKQIPYKNIRSIREINSIGEMLTGYQLLTSKRGLEISYHTGVIGSVKISPVNQEKFLVLLLEHCPNVQKKALS